MDAVNNCSLAFPLHGRYNIPLKPVRGGTEYNRMGATPLIKEKIRLLLDLGLLVRVGKTAKNTTSF